MSYPRGSGVPHLNCSECEMTFLDEYDWVLHLAEHHPGAWERWYHTRYREEAAHRRAQQ